MRRLAAAPCFCCLANGLHGTLGRKVAPEEWRWSVAVSFERVAEDDPRSVAAGFR